MFVKIQSETCFLYSWPNWRTSFKIREMSENEEHAIGRACPMKRKWTTNGRERNVAGPVKDSLCEAR